MNISQALVVRGEPDSYERQENAWLLGHILDMPVLDLRYRINDELSDEQYARYISGLERIASGELLAYVIGSQPFWTLDLKVTQDTLVPRPDTEILVETCLTLPLPKDADIIDLGTGTGAIALSLASEQEAWSVIATDVYLPTLQVAQENALKHGLIQVEFALGSWFDALNEQAKPRFDLIVSNPPYIDRDDPHMQRLGKEPERALVAEQKGLADIELIIHQGKRWLNDNGWIVLEHGYEQSQAVRQIFAEHDFRQIRTVKDYGGNDRVTLGRCSLSFQ